MREGTIEYNGRVYESWDDLPDEARAAISAAMPDTDGDGVPDMLQRGVTDTQVTTTVTRSVVVDGVTYDSVDELPPHLREHLRDLLPTMSPDGVSTHRVSGGPVAVDRSAPAPGPVGPGIASRAPTPDRRPWWRRLFG